MITILIKVAITACVVFIVGVIICILWSPGP